MKPFSPQDILIANDMLDNVMPKIPPAAWKILCYVVRHTQKYTNLSDDISIPQFAVGCGINESLAIESLSFCIREGYLIEDRFSNRYIINEEKFSNTQEQSHEQNSSSGS